MAGQRFDPQAIRAFAEQLGHGALPDKVASAQALDVEFRVRQIVQEGLKFMRHGKRTVLTADDVNNALRLRNVEPLYGYAGANEAPDWLRVEGQPGVLAQRDAEVDLEDAIRQPLPKPPVQTLLSTHWLAVCGVQPAVPENPAPPPAGGAAAPGAGPSSAAPEPPAVMVPVVAHVVSKELHLFFDRVTELVGAQGCGAPAELFDALQRDGGLQPLAPYFSAWFAQLVGRALGDAGALRGGLAAARALLSNPRLSLEAYLQQLIPALLTCLVARSIGAAAAAGGADGGEHWDVRLAAARALAAALRRHSHAYPEVQPRVARTLLTALRDPGRSCATHFGALAGLAALGHRTQRHVLLPSAPAALARLAPALAAADGAPRREAERLRGALAAAAGGAMRGLLRERPLPRAAAAAAAAAEAAPAPLRLRPRGAPRAPAAEAGPPGRKRARTEPAAAGDSAGPGDLALEAPSLPPVGEGYARMAHSGECGRGCPCSVPMRLAGVYADAPPAAAAAEAGEPAGTLSEAEAWALLGRVGEELGEALLCFAGVGAELRV